MIPGLSGSLLSHEVVESLARESGGLPPTRDGLAEARRAWRRWHAGARNVLGPSCGARRVFDLVAEPLSTCLGLTVVPRAGTSDRLDALLRAGDRTAAVMSVTSWGAGSGALWNHAVRVALAYDLRWAFCVTGLALRILDARRAYARRFAEFDLGLAAEDDRTFAALYLLLNPVSGHEAVDARLDRVVALCEQHRSSVRISLRTGVHEALTHLAGAFRAASRRHADASILHESLTVIYRVLFLLFAEARGLVPGWHPVYRDSYRLEGICRGLPHNPAAGLWQGLQAVARLAHHGCHAGTLRVPAFNGRLFSPSDAPLADSLPLSDDAVAGALRSLMTRAGVRGRERISYGDLGVEQLGGVYEHLLDFDIAPGPRDGRVALVPTGRRKSSGSFYTPRSLTDFLVRRTLAPLVAGRSPDAILRLRVLDPAMGSGAFLVSACRYLATAYEQAALERGALAADDVTDADRAAFRRMVAQRCLYGVDVNPVAVQLGRLSLWLATLAADRPLTFLDHHLRSGNSLVGATVDAIRRNAAPGRPRRRAPDLPLFDREAFQESIQSVLAARASMADTPDDSVEQVREKEKALASLTAPAGPVEPWRAVADLWCAAWYGGAAAGLSAAGFRGVVDGLVRGGFGLPGQATASLVAGARQIARAERFFHWPLEFPEIFYDAGGAPLAEAGFDAVIGNPPWEMLRQDARAPDRASLLRFARGSGLYVLQGGGHGNLYQLFLERALQLLRPGGRCGFILPSGLAIDHGSGPLRLRLLTRASVDTFTMVENRDGIFPIHRGLKFLLVTLTDGGSTNELPVRAGVWSTDALDGTPDTGPGDGTVCVPRGLLERLGGDDLAIPEVRGPDDLEICSLLAVRFPGLGDPDGWRVRFGRELNATEDRPHFTSDGTGLPVVEGKQLQPFRVDVSASRFHLPRGAAARLLDPDGTFGRARLGYRDVASPANRLTLIAAVLPAGVVTTHTVFCLKDRLGPDAQHFLCGVFNSYVANYLVRMRVGTHVTAVVLGRLPVPKPPAGDVLYREIAAASRILASRKDSREAPRLQALVAALYGLTAGQFHHVLQTFPLVPAAEREAALQMYRARHRPV